MENTKVREYLEKAYENSTHVMYQKHFGWFMQERILIRL